LLPVPPMISPFIRIARLDISRGDVVAFAH
jgi:hypothetical protein